MSDAPTLGAESKPMPEPAGPAPHAIGDAPPVGAGAGLSASHGGGVGRCGTARRAGCGRAAFAASSVNIEPWSVLKVSLIFYFCAWAIMLFVGFTLWNLAVSSGLVDKIENFVVELFALQSFQINGDQIFRIAAVGGLVLVVAVSGLTVLGAVLFNLISDVTGGVRLTVVEEETARPRPRRSRRRVLVVAPPSSPSGEAGGGSSAGG